MNDQSHLTASNPFKDLFLLDPRVTFLNHGSFGAVPRPVFEIYQSWQRELERQPVEFLGRLAPELLGSARKRLANYLHVEPDDLLFVSNPTTAVNLIARNMARPTERVNPATPFVLRPGDEILTTDHEYGALNRTWRYICGLTGALYRPVSIPLPLEDQSELVERIWSQVNPHTRLIFISHITSPTALTFPIKEICSRARQAGILCLVDGAHAPGQIPLDLAEVGADIYTGACHKWLCAPKGSAFLYVRRELQETLDPLIVSWGYESENPSASQFIDYHEWQGTRDLAAYLSVPAAIEFQESHNWGEVRGRCHDLAVSTRRRIEQLTGLSSLGQEDDFIQMFTVRLPDALDLDRFKSELYDRFQVEAPTICWAGKYFLRISFQAYNDQADADRLIESIKRLL
jgi:isopenicillin-N epimerase